ncbi:hypothetical protein GCM10011359_28950 [Nesterenkonia alkaliphila]|nr:hypothetical protein GCM10011359_28950 [Nesterenkonia alkaliphila]
MGLADVGEEVESQQSEDCGDSEYPDQGGDLHEGSFRESDGMVHRRESLHLNRWGFRMLCPAAYGGRVLTFTASRDTPSRWLCYTRCCGPAVTTPAAAALAADSID